MMNRTLRNMLWMLLVLLGLSPVMAQENDWPRTVALDEGTVTIYQPQVDEMTETSIRFRAALAWREKPGAEPVFGAGWFESDVQVDRFSRTVHPVELKVSQTRFPVEADVQTSLSKAMAQPSFASNFTFSLDELEASLASTKAEAKAAEKLNTAPPEIIYRDRPALLVTIDGDPVIREIENSQYEAVINTPYPLIRDGQNFYLNAAEGVWYRAGEATGPYRFVDKVPAEIDALVKQAEQDTSDDGSRAMLAPTEKVTASNAPEIVVSTVPAELVVTEGPAAFVPLVDDLLVLNNSDDDVFMHLSAQDYYIVLAGRWYRSKSLNGPWAYQDSDRLPVAFAQIPQDSEQADSRVYVAGTEEAQEAVLDAQVPQTAAIKRGEADVDVQYDGEPAFAPVDGTDMVYANNTGSTVILADGLYYLIEDGVWYVSTSPDGPWQVSINRPDQVRVIQPTSPVYNVKYVYIYDYTPQVVYTGYTSGYMGSYVYGPTMFYGSGWYYRPWVSPRYYYPRHSTWGFHVNYDPWYGWNFGLSWAWGPFSFSYWPGGYWHHNHYWHHRYYSYWGPHGYRPRYHHHRPPGHGRPGHGRPPGHGNRPHPYERNHNLYRDGGQRAVVADSRDKAPRSYGKSPAGASFKGKSYVKNGVDGKYSSKDKAMYSMQQPVSRNDLAVKAKKQDSGFKASQIKAVNSSAGKAYSKAHAARVYDGGASKTPAQKVTRNDLASKAKSSDQGYRASQKKVVSASGPKPGYSKSLSGKVVQPKVSQKSYVKSSPKVKVPTSSARTKLYNSTKSAPLAKSSAKVTTPSSSVKARTNYKMKSAPVVKLTRPSSPSTSYSKAKSSTAPASRSQSKPQYSYKAAPKQSTPRQSIPKQSAAKQSAARQSSPKQAYSAPSRSAPQKSSRPAMNNKSKQARVK